MALRPVGGKPLIVPEGVSDEEATFVEPLADAIYSIVDQGKIHDAFAIPTKAGLKAIIYIGTPLENNGA